MIRVKGIVNSPIEEPIKYTSLLIQCITGSLDVLPNSYALIELDETGLYDFTILNGSYRVYANYENSMKVTILGEFSVSDGMNEEFYTLNRLVSNFSPQAPDWASDLDYKWQGLFDRLVNDVNTRTTSINQAIKDGDALAIRDMSTFVNDELGAQAAAITDQIQAGNAQVLAQSKAYTDIAGNEIASNVTEVKNSLSTVSQQLTTYKDETNSTFSQITNRIDTNEANLISEITAEVNAQTGEMELRIQDVISTEIAEVGETISLVQNEIGALEISINNYIDTEVASLGTTISAVQSDLGEFKGTISQYIDTELASVGDRITLVQNDLGTVETSLTRYINTELAGVEDKISLVQTELGEVDGRITQRIDTEVANVGGEISLIQNNIGTMEVSIKDYINTEVASVGEEISLVKNELGAYTSTWQVVTTVDKLTSAIGMVNDGISSTIYLQAQSLVLTNNNSNPTAQFAPFAIQDNKVTMSDVVINEDCVIKGTLKVNQIEGDVIKAIPVEMSSNEVFSKALHSGPAVDFKVFRSLVIPEAEFDRKLQIPPIWHNSTSGGVAYRVNGGERIGIKNSYRPNVGVLTSPKLISLPKNESHTVDILFYISRPNTSTSATTTIFNQDMVFIYFKA